MPKNTSRPAAGSKPASTKANGQEVLNASDLTELKMESLATQIENSRLEILAAIREVGESAEIIAREVARHLSKGNNGRGHLTS